MKIEASKDLLISQWRIASNMSGMVQGAIDVMQENIANSLDDLEDQWDVDKASGVWLDFLAARVGLTRPLAISAGNNNRFGFRDDDSAMSFDTVPFKGGIAAAERYPLSDFTFRRFVKARGILDVSRGEFPAFERAIKAIDQEAIVTDNRDMSVTVQTDAIGASSEWNGSEFEEIKDVKFADQIGALPRSAGVRMIVLDGARFGFRGAGDPFDQARFR